MNVLMVGGGTGGHVYPAVAIAEAFACAVPGVHIAFAGMRDGFEAKILRQYPWTFHPVSAAPLKGLGVKRKIVGLGIAVQSCCEARRLLRTLQPDCVVGTGGYVSGPITLTAALMRIPTVIHEQNSVPGFTNRFLGRVVKKVCTTFAESARYFPRKKVAATGLPVRKAVVEAMQAMPMKEGQAPVILVMGGSQGARRLNELCVEMASRLATELPGCRVIHQTGRSADVHAIQAGYQQAGVEAEVMPFIDGIGAIYAQVHVVVSRAGAGSVAELALSGLPTIFVPFPHATDNHQEMNAREVVARGGGVLMRECDLTADRLCDSLVRILRDPARMRDMSEAMVRFAKPEAAANVVQVCQEVVGHV